MKPLREIALSTVQNIQKKMDKWQKAQKQHHQNKPDMQEKKPLRTIAPSP